MAIQRYYETTVDRLKIIFKNKLLDPSASFQYFKTMYPYSEMSNSDICGFIRFIEEWLKIDEYRYEDSVMTLSKSKNCFINTSKDEQNIEITIWCYTSLYATIDFVINSDIEDTRCYVVEAFITLISRCLSELYEAYYLDILRCSW